MTGNLYATMGLTCALVCMILFRCNKEVFAAKIKNGSIYIWFLVGYTVFGLLDAFWGLLDSKTIVLGKVVFWITSYLFHLLATLAVLGWFLFVSLFFNIKESRLTVAIESLPALGAVMLLVFQPFNECIYYIDSDLIYHSGNHRQVLYYIQIYFLFFAFVKGVIYLLKNRKTPLWEHKVIVLEFITVPIVMGFLQMIFPNGPYYSIGILLTSVTIFNGVVVVDKARESERYELVSKETYKALEALCSGFISVHLFDLRENRQVQVKSSVFVDVLANNADNAHDQIRCVAEGICTSEFRDEMLEFVDTYTLDERMSSKKSISKQFEGKVSGWCVSTFIAVEYDDEGHLIKVIHAVQSIDEAKRKEIEFTQAIKRAYENKNAIYAELVKMQSVGMIATDEEGKLILANDVAASMFGHEGENVEGRYFSEFFDNFVMETPEVSTEKYSKIIAEGGQFSYELKVPSDNEESNDRYLNADVKRVDLLDGSKVMVTCYSDITKRKLLEKKLRNLSDIDGLTGIYNRRYGEKSIKALISEKTPGLFCMMDVNDFKHINDTYGHKMGDDALIAVAGAIKKSFRSDDIIMRLGGDEFAVFAKNVTSTGLAKSKIDRLFENIENISIEGFNEEISICLGAVLIEEPDRDIEYGELYSTADEAMYSCKGKGGNNAAIEEIK